MVGAGERQLAAPQPVCGRLHISKGTLDGLDLVQTGLSSDRGKGWGGERDSAQFARCDHSDV